MFTSNTIMDKKCEFGSAVGARRGGLTISETANFSPKTVSRFYTE